MAGAPPWANNNTVASYRKAAASLKIILSFYALKYQGLTGASSWAGGAHNSIREAHRSHPMILSMQLLSLLICNVSQICNAYRINISSNDSRCQLFTRIKMTPNSNHWSKARITIIISAKWSSTATKWITLMIVKIVKLSSFSEEAPVCKMLWQLACSDKTFCKTWYLLIMNKTWKLAASSLAWI